MKPVKVYKTKSDPSGILSSAEAWFKGCSIRGCNLASIEDCKKANAIYSGPIIVKEGTFEYDYDKNEYVKIPA